MDPFAHKGTHVLVTGGTGFIGSHVSDRLLNDGYRVTVLTRNPAKPASAQLASQGAEVIQADLTDAGSIGGICGQLGAVDVVMHFAANLNLWGEDMKTANIAGTRHALRLAEQAGAKYVVFASSVEAQGLGSANEVPLTEERECRPASAYGDSKLQGEALIQPFAERTGVPTLIARIGHTYGVGGFGFVQPLLHALFAPDSLAQVLPYVSQRLLQPIYVDDLVEAFVRALRMKLSGVYNFTGSQPVTLGEWFLALGELLGVEELARQRLASANGNLALLKPYGPLGRAPEVAYYLMGEGDRVHRAYSDANLRAAVGDYQRHNLYRGLAATVAWYQRVGALEPLLQSTQ